MDDPNGAGEARPASRSSVPGNRQPAGGMRADLGGGMGSAAAALAAMRSGAARWFSRCRPHLIVGLLAVLLVCAGLVVSLRVGDDRVARLEEQIEELRLAVEENAAESERNKSWQMGAMPPDGCDLEGMEGTSLGRAASGACLVWEGARLLMGEDGG